MKEEIQYITAPEKDNYYFHEMQRKIRKSSANLRRYKRLIKHICYIADVKSPYF